METTAALQEFPTKNDLIEAYSQHMTDLIMDRLSTHELRTASDGRLFQLVRQTQLDNQRNYHKAFSARYQPSFYKGGHAIPGFGYSVERIAAGYISAERAGDPELVNDL
jgi:hypothetical protein